MFSGRTIGRTAPRRDHVGPHDPLASPFGRRWCRPTSAREAGLESVELLWSEFLLERPCPRPSRRTHDAARTPRPRCHSPDRDPPFPHATAAGGTSLRGGNAHATVASGARVARPGTTSAGRVRVVDATTGGRLLWRLQPSRVLPDSCGPAPRELALRRAAKAAKDHDLEVWEADWQVGMRVGDRGDALLRAQGRAIPPVPRWRVASAPATLAGGPHGHADRGARGLAV